MKFLHISDLHIGKKVNEYSMIEEQKHILNQVIKIAENEKAEALIIAGDLYDKTIPAAEAVQVCDNFLSELSARHFKVFIISGNHDSAERVSFGNRIMKSGGIHISPVYSGKIEPIKIQDEYGDIYIYMMPFIKPFNVRSFYPEKEILCTNDAVREVVESMEINPENRNILIAHQFVTGASLSNSEEFAVGGSDSVDAEIFKIFDYTALGHIHRPQYVKYKNIRYCGSQLKYAIDEEKQVKSVTVVEMDGNGNTDIKEVPLVPLRDFKSYKGSFSELTDKNFYINKNPEDYTFIILTDEQDIPDAERRLRKIYPHMMSLKYDNTRTRTDSVIKANETENIPPSEIVSDFYKMQCGHDLSNEQKEFVEKLINKIWEEEIL